MTNKEIFPKIADFLVDCDDYLITTHFSPDGDAIGSCLGMGELLKSLGKKYIIVLEGGLPEKYDFIGNKVTVFDSSAVEFDRRYSKIIILDAGDYKRIGKTANLIVENPRILNIDHHLSNNGFGEVSYIEGDASSVSEILFNLARFMKVHISAEMASYLYIGVMTDTGRFRFSNTSASALKTCAELVALGAKPMELTEAVYFDLPRSYIEALGKSLYSLQFLGDGRLALMEYLDRDEIEDAEGFIDFAIGVKGVKSAVFIRSMEDGRFKVSLRARDSLDVREIAESYGGGGHTKAAGFRFRGSLDQLKFDLIRKILERLG
jgi:phosphoesterase RecJ-like protein